MIKSFINLLALSCLVMLLVTVAKFTVTKFDEHYVPPKEQRVYPRLSVLPPVKLGIPSFGTKSAMVRLYQEDGMPLCTGIVIDSKYVLTAAHCILTETGRLETDKIIVTSMDKSLKVEGKAASAYSRSDVGVILGDFKEFKIAPVLTTPKTILELTGTFISCGFPYGGDLFCSNFFNFSIDNFMIVANGPVSFPGMSGGPVVSLTTGAVFAVNSASRGGSYGVRSNN